jgi:hypothetical protein
VSRTAVSVELAQGATFAKDLMLATRLESSIG